MRKLTMLFLLILISGCGMKEQTEDESQRAEAIVEETSEAVEEVKEEKSSRSNESLEDLLTEVNLEAKLTEVCSNLKIEMTTAFLEADSHRPSIVGFCHNNGDVSLEQEPSYIAIANYDESTKVWAVDVREHEFMYQPSRFAGILQLDDTSERVVIQLYEDPATFGGTSAIVVSSENNKIVIERINSTVTQFGEFRTEGNEVIIEDDHTTESYTYSENSVTHTTHVNEVTTDADINITYNKVNDTPLFATFQSGKILDVEVGDIISFQPDKPLSLVDFQIRTSLKKLPDIPDTFVVGEGDIGETIEFGEYPYDEMIVYYVGDPYWFTSHEYLAELNKGNMPGSKVQLSTPNSEIKTILGDENLLSEYGLSGAMNLEYEQFVYAIPFLEEEGDVIYSVIRKLPFGTNLTGDDFIESWGEPTSTMTNMDSVDESLILHYALENDHYVHIYLHGPSTDAKAEKINLY
ncbi:hypothetical protein [Aquibacillus rhizosphaerae]|uniref:DUF4309 domain-containing protein n=1 Tax=Aquibacillus rhizosphaerae TaxID=3051431 RepID=A0ABT7L3W1_9BACI|nr:hypothetical protein [Aquibacillus sp. LR5S19]MDL4840555.1 hypothetical protein [Aquibacillus sp. LR5S19]